MATSSIRINSLLIKQKKVLNKLMLRLCWETMDGNEQYSNRLRSNKIEGRFC